MTHQVDSIASTSSKPDALHFLQIIRGGAAVGVVFYHAAMLLHDKAGSAELGWWFSWGFSGVHIFFVLSGFIICLIHFNDIGRPLRASHYLYKRFARIFPVYWVALLIGALFFTPGSKGVTWYFYFENISLLRITNHDKVIAVAWTLSHEILFYLAFLLLIMNRRIGITIVMIWLGVIFCVLITGLNVSPPYLLARITGLDYAVFTNLLKLASSSINLLFALGASAFFLYRTLSKHPYREVIGDISLLAGLLIFVAASLHWLYMWDNSYVGWGGYNAVFGCVGFLLMIGLLSQKVDVWSIRHPLLIALGDASFSIYLVHYGIQKFLISQFGIPVWLDLNTLYLALVVIPVASGLLFFRLVEVPLLKLFGRSNGKDGHKMLPRGRPV